MKVYLAGPITEDRGDREDWRDEATTVLALDQIDAKSPKPLLRYTEEYGVAPLDAETILTVRDFWFATKCDVVLANFENSTKASIGTCIELGWASASEVPIVSVIPEGNVHVHPMVLALSTWRAYDLEEGLRIVCALNGARL